MMNAFLFQTLRRAALAALTLVLPVFANAQYAYTATEITTPDGEPCVAYAINKKGQITGYAVFSGSANAHPFLYENGIAQDLTPSASFASVAYGLNNRGEAVGQYYLQSDSAFHALVFQNGGITDLGNLGFPNAYGQAINDSGQVVGFANTVRNGGEHAFLYQNGTMIELGTLGGSQSHPYAINNSGQIVGRADLPAYITTHAFLYQNGVMQDLGSLGGPLSSANAITEDGRIVGSSQLLRYGNNHMFLYENGVMQDLGTLNGNDAEANAINKSGIIVGGGSVNAYTAHAIVRNSGRIQDLNNLLLNKINKVLVTAEAINDDGWIICQTDFHYDTRSFLLKPTPLSAAGRIAVEGVSNLSFNGFYGQPVTAHLAFRAPGTTSELYGTDVFLTPVGDIAFGAFVAAGIPVGTYDVAVKSSKSLRVVLPNVTVSPSTFLPDVTLPGGDANGDNRVDIEDFGLLVSAYNSFIYDASSGYNPQADFNYDGVVDIADFGLLVNEYGNSGAP